MCCFNNIFVFSLQHILQMAATVFIGQAIAYYKIVERLEKLYSQTLKTILVFPLPITTYLNLNINVFSIAFVYMY